MMPEPGYPNEVVICYVDALTRGQRPYSDKSPLLVVSKSMYPSLLLVLPGINTDRRGPWRTIYRAAAGLQPAVCGSGNGELKFTAAR